MIINFYWLPITGNTNPKSLSTKTLLCFIKVDPKNVKEAQVWIITQCDLVILQLKQNIYVEFRGKKH